MMVKKTVRQEKIYFAIITFSVLRMRQLPVVIYFIFGFLSPDDNDSLNRSFTCRMKCTLNHGGGFYKVNKVHWSLLWCVHT